jgi:NADH:ubiquinone oxidoreductase subunit C
MNETNIDTKLEVQKQIEAVEKHVKKIDKKEDLEVLMNDFIMDMKNFQNVTSEKFDHLMGFYNASRKRMIELGFDTNFYDRSLSDEVIIPLKRRGVIKPNRDYLNNY